MTRAARRLLVLAVLAGAALAPARAEQLVTALSHETVSISSNFTGTQVVVFGTIERDAQTVARAGAYEVVITLAGPAATLVTRRKDRTFGIWINTASEVIEDVPSFLAVHSTRPLEEIAGDTVRARLGLGIDMLPINAEPSPVPPERTDFEAAFLRLMQEEARYAEVDGGVEFLGAQLFRAKISLPATVTTGTYVATARLFRGGVLLSTTTQEMEIGKVGFEQYVSRLAYERGLVYGLGTVAIACLTGWLAGVLFRKD